MAGFAVVQSSPLSEPEPVAVGIEAPKPAFESFGAATGAGFADQRQTRNTDARLQAVLAERWKVHQDYEKAAGRRLAPSDLMLQQDRQDDYLAERGIMAPGGVVTRGPSEDDYAAELAKLRAEHPGLAALDTPDQATARVDARLKAVRGRADTTGGQGLGGLAGSFAGHAAGAMTDLPNLLGLLYGGAGATRGIAAMMLEQGAFNAGLEAVQIPGRIKDAKLAGPDYQPVEAVTDVAAAGAGAAVLTGAGHLAARALKPLARALRPAAETEPALRGALDAFDQGHRDDLAAGPLDGGDRETVDAALAQGLDRPVLEPHRDLSELFSAEAGGGPDVAIYKGRPIYSQSFDPAGLSTDAARFQYKANADGEGVTARLKGVEAWDPLAAGRVLVWEDRAGAQFIGDGHQRFGLVRRLNDERGFEHGLDGYLFREADGWRAQDIRTVAALKNIREGSGSPLDAAKVFRDAPDSLADRSLPLTGEFMAQARGLAGLEDGAFRAVINKVIPERYAAEIGTMAAGRPDLHADMVGLMKAADPANVDEARALVVEALQDDWIKTEGDQADLFGYDPSQSAMIGRAKVAAAVKRALGRDARLFSGLIKHADAIEAGGNALARDANEARLAVDRAALEVSAKLALRSGPIGEAMAAAAKKVTAGETPATAAKSVLAQLRRAIEAGERLDDLRGMTLDPKAPTPGAEALVKDFDEVGGAGAKAQAVAAPEDAEIEAGGLFDDLAADDHHEKAHQALMACAPGGAEA